MHAQPPSEPSQPVPPVDESVNQVLGHGPGKPVVQRHTPVEDGQGLVVASLLSAFGMSLYAAGGLLTGGMSGASLLLHYVTGWNFGLLFILSNLPFYWLSMRRMGWEFTIKTFCAVGITGLIADSLHRFIRYEYMATWFAAVFGGVLVGIGILSFIRHRASLGGVGIMGVYLQQSRGWSAGKVQMAFDCTLMLMALTILPFSNVVYSALGAVVLNLVLIFNHKPGRYMGL